MWGGAGGSECARDPEASDLGLELIGLGSQERPAQSSGTSRCSWPGGWVSPPLVLACSGLQSSSTSSGKAFEITSQFFHCFHSSAHQRVITGSVRPCLATLCCARLPGSTLCHGCSQVSSNELAVSGSLVSRWKRGLSRAGLSCLLAILFPGVHCCISSP